MPKTAGGGLSNVFNNIPIPQIAHCIVTYAIPLFVGDHFNAGSGWRNPFKGNLLGLSTFTCSQFNRHAITLATSDKLHDFNAAPFGISVFETALASLLMLVHAESLKLVTLISKLTREPASILRRGDIGTLKAGARADVTIFDPKAEWTVDPTIFASKGKNTPLAGQRVRGKVMATICGGDVVHTDDALKSDTVHHQAGAPIE